LCAQQRSVNNEGTKARVPFEYGLAELAHRADHRRSIAAKLICPGHRRTEAPV